MARFVKGDIVILPFPLSGQAEFKPRPAVVLASWPYGSGSDYLVSIITSQNAPDPFSIEFDSLSDVGNGVLINRTPSGKSYLRPTYLYSVGEALIYKRACTLRAELVDAVIERIFSLLKA